MIETINLKFSYGSDQEFQFPGISYTEKKTVLITGNLDTGKTTLLHFLGGLLKPHCGQILINSQKINNLFGSKLDAFRGGNLGMILQKSHKATEMTKKKQKQKAGKMSITRTQDLCD